jgi:hypothetical protein
MYKLIFFIFFIPQVLFPQSPKFLPFEYKGAWGITDSACNETITPYYYRYENIPLKNDILLLNFDNGVEHLYFNMNDGTSKKYDNYDISTVSIENNMYSLIQDGEKYYLKNDTTDKILELPYPIESINNFGNDYILAKHEVIEKPKVIRKNKNGMEIFEPPKITGYDKTHLIFRNNIKLPIAFKKDAENVLPLYIDKSEPENDKVEIVTIEETINTRRNFDYLVFNSLYNYELYSRDFKLIKKFIYKGDNYDLAERCGKMVGKKLSNNALEMAPNVASYRDEYMPTPEFESVLENGMYKIISTDRNNPIVICESVNKLIYDDRNPTQIFIFDTEKEDYMAKFYFDRNTFKLFLPLKYYSLLKLNTPK